MDKLSVVIITYNEERNIRPCLEAALMVADEVLVVDSFSTDCTLNICEEMGVRFIQHEWKGYSEQKNFANAAASYDWILSVDADEVLDSTLQQAILEAKTKGFAGAYQVNRLTFYCGHPIRHCGWYPDIKLRLWNRTQGEWDGYIHEEIKLPAGTPITRLSGHLNHYSYHSISEHIRQADKFTDMTARAAFERGEGRKLRFTILCKAGWKFLRGYFFQLGFLDGYYGMVVCRISAFATFLKYTKLNELHQHAKHHSETSDY